MSDIDDTPEGFDKEAERRKLEEKYGDDAEQREDTQRMSELLLQGATMTNRHCDTCGSPIFRQNGQEFCPTCNAASNGSAVEDGPESSAQPSGSPPASDGTSSGDTQSPAGSDSQSIPADTASRDSQSESPTDAPRVDGQDPLTDTPRDQRRSPPPNVDGDASLDDARRALIQALNSHAAAGATADNPRRAQDHLAAAREAAETLAALR